MKEYTKKLIMVVIICVLTLIALFIAIKLYQNKINNIDAESKVSGYLSEVKYEDISSYVVEEQNAIIYVTNSSLEESKKFDNIFIPIIKKYNLENNIIYININGQNIMDQFYQHAPELLFYKDGEVTDMIDVSTLKTVKDVKRILKERSVIGD